MEPVPGSRVCVVIDPLYLYFRFRLRLVPFSSALLDSVADRMGVSGLLKGKEERYFLSGRGVSGLCFAGRIVFGGAYWSRLDDAERSAVAAHEFVHIRSRDAKRRLVRVVLPGVAVTGAFTWAWTYYPLPLPSGIVGYLLFVPVVVAPIVVLLCSYVISTLLNAPWLRRMELRCDVEAARDGVDDGEALVRALEVWEGMIGNTRRSLRYRWLSRSYPTLAERAAAIRRVTGADSIEPAHGS
ncbi:MAG: M48 family metalloprotease [Nitrososphaerales archaeon]|jgi:Zn-dependent protease with chaperone function